MAYNNSSRFRPIDKFTNWYYTPERNAYDEIVNDPERYLLTQQGVFDAEGGYTGVIIQAATMAGAVGALFTFQPQLASRFLKGSLGFNCWLAIGATGFLSYRVGYFLGYTVSGDYDQLNHHYAAYNLVKTQNRYEGRINLLKKPMMF